MLEKKFLTLLEFAKTHRIKIVNIIKYSVILAISIHVFNTRISNDAASTTAKYILQPANILSCNDGDTCEIKDSSGQKFKARLIAIDAPEISPTPQPLAAASQKLLVEYCIDQEAKIKIYGIDRYHRKLIELFCQSTNMNELLVMQGLADLYKNAQNFHLAEEYIKLKNMAKNHRIGIWALHDYESPSRYRKRLKVQKKEISN